MNDDAKALIEQYKRLDEIGADARRCINTDGFQRYKQQFQSAQDGIMDAMIRYSRWFCNQQGADVAVYAMNMARYVQKIEDLKILLIRVEADARKGILPEPKETSDGKE